MRANGFKIKSMVKVFSKCLTVIVMKATTKIIRLTAMELMNKLMVVNMLEIGNPVIEMARGSTHGLVALVM